MARIGASLSGIERTLLNRLAESNAAATMNNLRLAAGKRVIAPRDDVSVFATLSRFQTRLSTVTATMNNVTAANSLVSQTQSVVGRIRTQLELIQTELLKDEDQTLTASQRAASQAAIEAAVATVDSLAATSIDGRRMLDGSASYRVQGRNSSQVSRVTVHSKGPSETTGDGIALAGRVVEAATRAELTYTGTASAIGVGDGGNLTITGRAGSTAIAVSDAESLADVAVKINNASHETGVIAEVSGDTLTFQSVEYGSEATVSVSADSSFSVSGGYDDGEAQGTDMIAELGGIRYAPAKSAQLKHRETTGSFRANATVTITGELGSFSLAITNGQSLATVAAAINAQQDSTGIVARVDNVDLVLESKLPGATSQMAIEVTAGNFGTFEGYTAAAAAELTYTGSAGKLVGDVSFDLTGTGTDSYAFTDGDTLVSVRDTINLGTGTTGVTASVDADQLVLRSVATGSDASIAVTAVVGSFDLSGGNGDGTADGTNATAAGSGSDATTPLASLHGERLAVHRNGTHFEIEFAPGFEGDFNTMTIGDGGLNFALSTNLRYRSDLSIASLHASQLGGVSGRLTDLLTGGKAAGLGDNTSEALRIVEEALGRVDVVDGLVDGFYNSSISTSSVLLGDLQSDLEDAIQEADGFSEEEESVLLAKNEALASNAISGMAIVNQQRLAIVDMIKQAAGLL